MRNLITLLIVVLAFSSVVMGQNPEARTPQTIKKPELAGPAPRRDLNGAWVGPNGPTKTVAGAIPPMTPLGEARFKLNKPEAVYTVAATNDPYGTCDPFGFPRNIWSHGVMDAGMWFVQAPNRILMLYQNQRVWRDIWMDGRELPKEVDAKGAPDSRFYGYSVGHWDGDYTLVIDTTGTDERTWLDQGGHPHSVDMHVEEQYTRVDQKNLALTVTIDDPKTYTKPFQLLKTTYIWMAKQDFGETFCVPSDAVEYMNSLVKPTGVGDSAK